MNELKKKAYTPKTNQYLTPSSNNPTVPREIYIKEEIKWLVSCFINALNSNYILKTLKTKAFMSNIQIIKIVISKLWHISL